MYALIKELQALDAMLGQAQGDNVKAALLDVQEKRKEKLAAIFNAEKPFMSIDQINLVSSYL